MITWWCAFHHNYVGNSARYDQSYYCSVKVYCVPASERALLATTKFLVIVIAVDQYKNWGQFNKASIISASLVMSLMKRSVICAPLFTWPSELHINARNREITFCGFKPEVGCDYRRKSGVGPHGLCLWPPFTGVCAPWPHPRTVSAHSDVNQRSHLPRSFDTYYTGLEAELDCKYMSCKICFNVLNYVFIYF